MGEWHQVCPVDDLPNGILLERTVAGEPVLLVRLGDTVHATDPLCPHKMGHLLEGTLHGSQLTCPMHTATFDLATGRPQTGQDWAGFLATYPTRVREGVLEVLVPVG